ncbi:MAG: methylenetetrahydrofolate--tRNA-(uracil(54)-C(5))-methyltransferase (FADH(2)-oxidizing) TrmFO [Firmicutes bacterium]|nr:methylenetetrahydrofolate--tRNA-(uracil(54)-C(5))-methyltransferase (FADH(2)-oxidizing) TrmFO [Bacillota bacterium]
MNIIDKPKVKIIGAGLAGCEAALQLAKRKIAVELYEAKPTKKSPAHHSTDFAELVCSNSLKSFDPHTAHGLLKEELKLLDCQLLQIAQTVKIPAGGALAVDRELFAKAVTEKIKAEKLIEVKNEIIHDFDENIPTIIATGPLTLGNLAQNLEKKFGGNLSFYDAAAPIVSFESIDFNHAFYASRYDKGDVKEEVGLFQETIKCLCQPVGATALGRPKEKNTDYINCLLSKIEYNNLIDALTSAECAILKDFEKSEIFEGCMPVEIMAKRGLNTLRFGPLKPVGLIDPKENRRPYAVVQLRKENAQGTMYNIVGFQTNLKFAEQKKVFALIPALKNAEFLRYGVMHRNTYLNAPKVLLPSFQTQKYKNIFIAGQLSGVEGYVESIASGLLSAIYLAVNLQKVKIPPLPQTTILGALTAYITAPNKNFQPMNVNFGLLPPIDIKDKEKRKAAYVERSLESLKEFLEI